MKKRLVRSIAGAIVYFGMGLLVVGVSMSPTAAQSTCSTHISQAPALRGFRLGMTPQQVDAVFQAAGLPAGSKSFGIYKDCWDDASGRCNSRLSISSSAFPPNVKSGPLKDIVDIQIQFWGTRASRIETNYMLASVTEEYVAANRPLNASGIPEYYQKLIINSLALPGDWQNGTLSCNGFEARTSNSRFMLNRFGSVSVKDLAAETEIALSRRSALDRKGKKAAEKIGVFRP